jgi:multidrug transporter EmrE-like cation transporter
MFSELRYGYGLWFKEPVTAVKIGSLVLIILGIVGLNLSRIH